MSEWLKAKKQCEVDLEQISKLLADHKPLLIKCRTHPPDPIELSAIAAMLHSFYTGIENIFKRISLEIDGKLPKGQMWHRELLDSMVEAAKKRPAVVTKSLRDTLRLYQDFRHFFRHAYSFQMNWEKMAGLVKDCEDVFGQVQKELGKFFNSLKK